MRNGLYRVQDTRPGCAILSLAIIDDVIQAWAYGDGADLHQHVEDGKRKLRVESEEERRILESVSSSPRDRKRMSVWYIPDSEQRAIAWAPTDYAGSTLVKPTPVHQ